MTELKATGRLVSIGATEQKSDKFKKREFVIEITTNVNGNNYTNYAVFQLNQSNVTKIDTFSLGSDIEVSFNLKGTKWNEKHFNTLEAWKIGYANNGNNTQARPAQQQPRQNEGIPIYASNHTNNGGNGYAQQQQSSEESDLPF
jgi:hypothetical protein